MPAVLCLCVSWLCYPVSNKVFILADTFPVPGVDRLMCFNFIVDQILRTLLQWDHYFTSLSIIHLLF